VSAKLQRWQDSWNSCDGKGHWINVGREPTPYEMVIAFSRPDGTFLEVDGQPIVSVAAPPRAQIMRVVTV
jgi:hypothetical protein